MCVCVCVRVRTRARSCTGLCFLFRGSKVLWRFIVLCKHCLEQCGCHESQVLSAQVTYVEFFCRLCVWNGNTRKTKKNSTYVTWADEIYTCKTTTRISRHIRTMGCCEQGNEHSDSVQCTESLVNWILHITSKYRLMLWGHAISRRHWLLKTTGTSCRLQCVCGDVDTVTAINGFPYKISFINTCRESRHEMLLLNYSR
jgi:hypothetical protein